MGWDTGTEEWYNNSLVSAFDYQPALIGIGFYEDGSYFYLNHTPSDTLRFKSNEIDKLIKYMITNKFIK